MGCPILLFVNSGNCIHEECYCGSNSHSLTANSMLYYLLRGIGRVWEWEKVPSTSWSSKRNDTRTPSMCPIMVGYISSNLGNSSAGSVLSPPFCR